MTISLSKRTIVFGALGLLASPAMAISSPSAVLSDVPQTPNPRGDLLDVAAAQGHFTRFLSAVHAAGYEDLLRGQGPFTVFAPSDIAFRDMDQHRLTHLMEPRNRDELRASLGYHIVRARLTSETAHAHITHVQALNGYDVTVDGRDGLRVNDALVAMPDVQASNGYIQGINTVLSPPVMVASLRVG